MTAFRLILAWLVILSSMPFVLVAWLMASVAAWLCPEIKPSVRIDL